METKMLTKIKNFSLASIMVLSCQTTVFACMNPQRTTAELFEEYNDEFNRLGRPQYKIFIKLQKLFETKDQSTIKNDLIAKTQSLKNKDNNAETISDEEIYEVQKIWDQFKSFYNYDLLDLIMYPLHEPANKKNVKEMEKERKQKPLNLYAHPDKYKLSENNTKMDNFYRYLDNTSRPRKAMDFTIRPILTIALSAPGIIAFRAKANIVRTVCSLPSLLFPNYFFKNNNMSNDTRKAKIEILGCNQAIILYGHAINNRINDIKHHDNLIKRHDNAIKRKDLTISIKQQQARDALDVLFPKKNFSN